jgi:hypothetical protein
MSRFSRAEAEAAGWRITLEEEPRTEAQGNGRVRVFPGRVTAEKSLTGENEGQTLHESDETVGKLLERIYAYENRGA